MSEARAMDLLAAGSLSGAGDDMTNLPIPVTEEEIRTRLCQVSVVLRQAQRQLAELNQKWMTLVAERIELEHRLRSFDIYHAEQSLSLFDGPTP